MLRRPVEFAQFTSVRYSERLAELGAAPSVGSVGDSYDNALAETVIGLYKSELIRGPRQGPWDSAADVELATLGWCTGTTTSASTPIWATSRPPSSRRPTLPYNPTSKRLETNKPTLQESQGGSQDAQARRRCRAGRFGQRVARAQDVAARDLRAASLRGHQHRRGDDLSGLL